jgi:hypothetical protein
VCVCNSLSVCCIALIQGYFSEELLIVKVPTLSTIETRVTYSSVSIDLRISLTKFLDGKGLGFLCFCYSNP